MAKRSLTIEYDSYDSASDLGAEIAELVQECIDMADNAYAPYSKFQVSSLALLEDGTKVKGTNVENASYPVAICAERNVLANAISNYPSTKITKFFIFAELEGETPVPPCGMCRQGLVEAEQRQGSTFELYLISKNGLVSVFSSAVSLMPLHFDGRFLIKP